MADWTIPRPRGWRHASDQALVFLASADEAASRSTLIDHVNGCATCTQRLKAIERGLDAATAGLTDEADAAFTPSVLERQRAFVLRRIGGSRASARILPFPDHGPVSVLPRRHLFRRSVAAAAVGGLLVGAAAGRVFESSRPTLRPLHMASRTVGGPAPAETIQASAAADEAFLADFEDALETPGVEPLLALDALTPRPDIGDER